MYYPDAPPGNDELSAYLHRELIKIADAIKNIECESITFKDQNAALGKPRDGVTVKADGTNWNPGSGEGLYTYYNSTYNKL